MDSVIRGFKNVFRSPVKTIGIVLILSLSMTVALVMLMANQIIGQRIEDVKGTIGNIITVTPKGIFGFEGGGELLEEKDVEPISSFNHVTLVSSSLRARPSSTDLESAVEPGSFGERFGPRMGREGAFVSVNTTGTNLIGSLPSTSALGMEISLVEGRYFNSDDSDKQVAILGKELAEKNNLKIGSTFEMEEKKFEVVGIFDSGILFANNALYLPLKATQKIFDLGGDISEVQVTVDNISNVDGVVNEIKEMLGDGADVASELDRFSVALTPLESISQITEVAVIGSLVAGIVIIFFSMLITVRQRLKEIGILKAIGASSRHLVVQFVTETMTVSLFAAILAVVLSFLAGDAIVGGLVQQPTGGVQGGLARMAGRMFFGDLESLQIFNLAILGYALLIAIGIGILGSVIPALIASRLKPVEVIRLE